MSKNYFGLVDARNTKYQGLINDDQFAGIGMLIDQTTTLAISTWNASTMNGPSVIIYPTAEIFFGQLQANKPKGIVCFQFSSNEKCIINFANNDTRNRHQSITIAHVISGQSIVQVTANPQKNEFKVVQVHYINNQENQLKLLSKIFNSQISKDKIDLASFINKQYVQTSDLFELSGKNQLFFGFKDTISIGFKLENNAPNSVGFYKPFPRNLIFGRKIHYNIALPTKTSVEEGYFEPYLKTFSCNLEKASSLEYQKLSEAYFKKSTTFRNQFVTLDHLSYIYKELKEIGDKVKLESAKKFGQTLLENDYGSSQQNPNDMVIKEYTLEEMRQQIYKAAAKRNKTHYNVSRSPIRQRAKKPLENLYLNQIDSPNRDILTVRKTKEPTLNRYQSIVRSKQKQNSPFVDERSKKGFTYLHSTKEDAIKEVKQIIKMKKYQEKALIQNLVDELKSGSRNSIKKRQFNYSNDVEEPMKRSRKYQRYEPKITPFSQVNERNSRSALKSSIGRQVRYLHLQKAKQDPASSPRSDLYEIMRRDKSVDKISAFELNREQTNTKSHANLSKYKERHNKATIDNLMKKDQKHQYKYLNENQNQLQGYGMQRNKSQIMSEIKLFEERTRRDKQNQPFAQGETNSRSGRHLNQDLSKSTHLGHQKSHYQRYPIPDSTSFLDKPPNQLRYKGLRERSNELQKDYSRPKLYQKTDDSQHMRNEDKKKPKRTYHYVD